MQINCYTGQRKKKNFGSSFTEHLWFFVHCKCLKDQSDGKKTPSHSACYKNYSKLALYVAL